MFGSPAPDPSQDSRLQQLLAMVSEEFFGLDEDAASLDLVAIERRAHEAGRKLARRLCEQAASQPAASAGHRPQPCPDCGRPSPGAIAPRRLETRHGPIELAEARHDCPRCRRAFFPRWAPPGAGSPPLQPGGYRRRGRDVGRRPLVRGGRHVAGDLRRAGDLAPPPPDALPGDRRRLGRRATAGDSRLPAAPGDGPPGAAEPPIALAAVMVDGGRLQTRQPERGPGVHEPARKQTTETVRYQALQNKLDEKFHSTIDSDTAIVVNSSQPMKVDRRQGCRKCVSVGQRLKA
jgi:hypothetical protein